MNIVRDMHGGRDYDATFGKRQTGSGNYAAIFAQRFRLKCRKLGLQESDNTLDTSLFSRVEQAGTQMDMF